MLRILRHLTLAWLSLDLLAGGDLRAGAPSPVPDAAGPDAPVIRVAELGRFEFENGEAIDDLRVTYVTFGALNDAGDNVVLALHPFTSDYRYITPLVGPGKAIDTEAYFVVAPDFLANSQLRDQLTTGPTNSGLMTRFPEFSVRDSVEVDYRLVTEHLGLERVRAAIGSSIGAMKAYQLAVSHPDFVRGIIPIGGGAATSAEARAILRNVMHIIASDPDWQGGFYDVNPATMVQAALMTVMPWWTTEQYYVENAATPAQIAAYERFWQTFWGVHYPQDARDVYYALRAWETFNLGDTEPFGGDAASALASIKAEALLLAIADDRLVRPAEMRFADEHIPNSRYVEVPSSYGHLATIWFDPAANATMEAEISAFLEGLD